MSAINYSFPIEQGSDFSIGFQYNDENGLPINLTESACVIFQIDYTTADDNPTTSGIKVISTSSANNTSGFSISASNNGLITLSIPSDITKTLNYASAVYDLDVIKDGKSLRLAYGNITIEKRQTAPASCTPSPGTNNGGGSVGGGTTTTPDVPVSDASDLCLDTDCLNLDIYSTVYSGMPISVGDFPNALSISSGSIITYDTRKIENVELVINNLNHNSPQDLQMFLCPPSRNKILLAANHKIPQNSGNFNFMFSNKAPYDKYLHNVTNGGLCKIYDKTSFINYSNESLDSSFDNLCSGISITGTWNLLIRDTDPISSGSIDGWKLIVTYIPIEQN